MTKQTQLQAESQGFTPESVIIRRTYRGLSVWQETSEVLSFFCSSLTLCLCSLICLFLFACKEIQAEEIKSILDYWSWVCIRSHGLKNASILLSSKLIEDFRGLRWSWFYYLLYVHQCWLTDLNISAMWGVQPQEGPIPLFFFLNAQMPSKPLSASHEPTSLTVEVWSDGVGMCSKEFVGTG